MGKRKKRAIGGKQLIIISSIIALNAMGVSYAYWTDQLQIITTLTTGNMNLAFSEDSNNTIKVVPDEQYRPSIENNRSDVKVNATPLSQLKVAYSEDHHTMYITGQIQEGYKAMINYGISNDGTIPIKYDQNQINSRVNSDLTIKQGLNIQVTQDPLVLNPQETIIPEQGNSRQELKIQVPTESGGQNKKISSQVKEIIVPEVHTFNLILPFAQWNKTSNLTGEALK